MMRLVRRPNANGFRVATSETARDINRRVVMNLIRRYQPISRADLSRQSGLQRSTVSLITDQLIKERWVSEGAVGHLPRGRKPTYLHLNGERAGIICINVRPGQTTIGLANLDFRFIAMESMATGKDAKRFISNLVGRVGSLMKAHPHIDFEGIGVALPGRLDLVSNRLVFAPNLNWDNLDIKGPLEDATGLSVELENAANACALAELWSGRHAIEIENLVAVTVSEGIGIGMILNGRLVRGANGMAGEFGHVTLDENGPLCSCGNRGCWEVCGSNSAAIRYYTDPGQTSRVGGSRGVAPTFDQMLTLAAQGDSAAGKALDRMARYLGKGLALLMAGISPEVIVVVGEVTRAWDRVGPIVDAVVKDRLTTRTRSRILATDPSTEPRLRGTIALVLQKHFGSPLFQ